MAELTAEIAASVIETCRAGTDEAAEALTRALDLDAATVEVLETQQVAMNALPDGFDGPGLAVVLTVGDSAAIFALAEASGMVPSWAAAPDPTGQSKLTTLAQELGMILLPEQFMPDDFQAARVKTLKGGLARGGVADGAALVPIAVTSGASKATAALIFPAPKPATVIGAAAPEPPKETPQPQAALQPAAPTQKPPRAQQSQPPRRQVAGLDDLPNYSRSLLRIKVPVIVTLAEKRQSLDEIMELGPGSIIQFEKSCEEMLELDVGGRPVATGEAVKVGDKFGLRISAMIMPDERFEPLGGPRIASPR